MSNETKVVLVTGASSGIGKAIADHFCQKGYRVYGTSRNAKPDSSQEGSDFPVMLNMDVNDDHSVVTGIEQILLKEGRLDLVVNNAGFGLAGAVEETTVEEAKAQFETVLFGALRVCRAALPQMRKAGEGCIINISSLAGVFAIPFQGFYSAAKFALEGMTEALRMEVRPFGIRVVLIEPGDMQTGFTANRRVTCEAARDDSPYQEYFSRSLGVMVKDEQSGPLPEPFARLVEKIFNINQPRLRYAYGPMSQKSGVLLRKILPQRLFATSLMRYYRLK